jgi:hypothetical protein
VKKTKTRVKTPPMSREEFLRRVDWTKVAADVRASVREMECRRGQVGLDASHRLLNIREATGCRVIEENM